LNIENSDDEEMEIGRRSCASSKKIRLDSYTPPPSDHDEAHGGDDERDDDAEVFQSAEDSRRASKDKPRIEERQPIRLTIRHSSLASGPSTPVVTMVSPPIDRKLNERRRSKKKDEHDDESPFEDLGGTSARSSSEDDDDADHDEDEPDDGSKSKRKRGHRRKKSKVSDKSTSFVPDPFEPPELQVMVSDSELWFINERNSKHKQETTTTPANQVDGETAEQTDSKSSPTSSSVLVKSKTTSTPATIRGDSLPPIDNGNQKVFGHTTAIDGDKEGESRLNVVITDVKAHNYSVIIKECYRPTGFFKNSS
jgi:hypothetical protein